MSEDDASERYAERITAEQIGLLLDNFLRQIPALLIIAPVVVATMWGQLPRLQLVLWGGVYLGSVLERRWFALRYLRTQHTPQEARACGLRFAVRTAFGGMLIGSCAIWMFTPESTPHQTFLFAFLFVASAGAPLFYAQFLPVFYAYLPWVMLPLAFRILLVGTEAGYWGAVAVTIYTVVLLQAGRDYSAATRRNFALRFENLDLVKELTVKKEEAERANRAKSQFLAAASHDLRQPMQALSLLTGTLKLRSAPGPDRELAERIGSSVEALDGLFNALLDISKLDAAVIHPERAAVSLDKLFTRIERDAAPMAEAKGLRLRIRRCGLWVDSDAVLLRRILQNLVANAIRYTAAGSVWVGARRRGAMLRIEVRDSGGGIAAQHLERIFEEFYQVENPERDRRKGLGLGLAIVRRLAALLDHPVEVNSAPGRGSVFALSVPLAEPPTRAEHETQATAEAADFRGFGVLVLEDDADVREAMVLVLRDWGCRVIPAADGDDALAQLADCGSWRADLILSDYRLRGGETGIQAARRLLDLWQCDIPVVLISGDTAAEPMQAARAGGYPLLHKPVRPDRLHRLLRSLFRGDTRGRQT